MGDTLTIVVDRSVLELSLGAIPVDSTAILDADYTAKGKILVGTGASTWTGLTVGTNAYVLTADSAEASGVKWAAASGGSSGSSDLLVYAPSIGASSSNVHKTWAELQVVLAAIVAAGGIARIYFPETCSIPTGSWLSGEEWISDSTSGWRAITADAGCVFTTVPKIMRNAGSRAIAGTYISYAGTAAPLFPSASVLALHMHDWAFEATGTKAVFQHCTGKILLTGRAELSSSTYQVVEHDSGTLAIDIDGPDTCGLGATNVIKGVGGTITIRQLHLANIGTHTYAQANFSGTLNQTRGSTYTEATRTTTASTAVSGGTLTQLHNGHLITCSTTGSTVALTLPITTRPFEVWIKKTTTDANDVTVARGQVADTIDGVSSSLSLLALGAAADLPCVLLATSGNGAWRVLSRPWQAPDAGLTSFLAVDTAADLLPYTTAAATWSATSLTAAARGVLDDATVGDMRTTLGLAIGTNVQAWDADLDAYAALATAGMVARTGAGTVSARTITAGTGISITNGDGVSGNPTITCTVTGGVPAQLFYARRA